MITEGQRGLRVTPISPADLEDVTELHITLELQALHMKSFSKFCVSKWVFELKIER